jgi:hypothetical protein
MAGYSGPQKDFTVNKCYQIPLKQTGIITGVIVVDAESQMPIKEFALSQMKHPGHPRYPGELISDPDGLFVLRDQNLGEDCYVYIKAEGYSPYAGKIEATKTEDNTIFSVEMIKPQVTTISVVDDETNQPLSGVSVAIKKDNLSEIDWGRIHQNNTVYITSGDGIIRQDIVGERAVLAIPPFENYAREITKWNLEKNITVRLKKGATINATLSPSMQLVNSLVSVSTNSNGHFEAFKIYKDWETKSTNEEESVVLKNLAPGEYNIQVSEDLNGIISTAFQEKVVIHQYGESVDITLGVNIGSSHLYGQLVYDGKPLGSENISVETTFDTDNVKQYQTQTNKDGYYEFNHLDDGKYIASVNYWPRNNPDINYLRKKKVILVHTNTEFNFDLAEHNTASVSFNLGEQDINQGFQVKKVRGLCQKDPSYVRFQQEDQHWALTEDVSGNLILKVTLSNGKINKEITLNDQVVTVNTMSHSSDLGTLSIPDTGSILLDVSFVGLNETNYPKDELFFLLTNEKGDTTHHETKVSVGPQGPQLAFYGLAEGDYTVTPAVNFLIIGDPVKASVILGKNTISSIRLKPSFSITGFIGGGFDYNDSGKYSPTRYLIQSDHQTQEIIPERKVFQNSTEAGKVVFSLMKENKPFALNGLFVCPVASEGPHTLTIEFEKFQTVTKEIEKALGMDGPITIPADSLNPKPE